MIHSKRDRARWLEREQCHPPESFFEAVLCIYVCFSADPDSFGTLDRYLSDFYENDRKNGILATVLFEK